MSSMLILFVVPLFAIFLLVMEWLGYGD
jgi:hypothetical protein